MTIVQDYYWEMIQICPSLETLAELAADLETSDEQSEFLKYDLAKIRSAFELVKIKSNHSTTQKQLEGIIAYFKNEANNRQDALAVAILEVNDGGGFELLPDYFPVSKIVRWAENTQDFTLSEKARRDSYRALNELLKKAFTSKGLRKIKQDYENNRPGPRRIIQ